jgi:hypothetical protein
MNHSFGTLPVCGIVEFLKTQKTMAGYDMGTVAFSCEDRTQNRYLVTFRVEVLAII